MNICAAGERGKDDTIEMLEARDETLVLEKLIDVLSTLKELRGHEKRDKVVSTL